MTMGGRDPATSVKQLRRKLPHPFDKCTGSSRDDRCRIRVHLPIDQFLKAILQTFNVCLLFHIRHVYHPVLRPSGEAERVDIVSLRFCSVFG